MSNSISAQPSLLNRRIHKRVGFTLIELLVVIAIISILAAILFPVFSAAREKARQTTCSSNMKQLGLGLIQYAQDYDEYLPAGGQSTGRGWAGDIYPYVKSTAVYDCPDDPTVANALSFTTGGNYPAQIPYLFPGTGLFPLSYAYNLSISYNGTTYDPVTHITTTNPPIGSMARFTAPVKTVLLCEVQGCGFNISNDLLGACSRVCSATTYGWDGNSNRAFTIHGGPAASGKLGVYATGYIGGVTAHKTGATYVLYQNHQPRHSGGSNWEMADGHVKWMLAEDISPGVTNSSATGAPDIPVEGGFHKAAGTALTSYTTGGVTYTIDATFSPR